MGIARVTLIGNVGREPEVRFTANGTSVANFSVAVTFKRKGGEDITQWHRVTVYDKLADIAGRLVHKGRQVYVEGRLNFNTYKDRDGNEKQQVEVIASELQVLGGRSDADRPAPATPQDEELPF